MDREDILLKEYEVCQSHNNSLGQQAWVTISILITVNIIAIGQVSYEILQNSFPVVGCLNFILVICLASVMVLILIIFYRWGKRIDFIILLNNERMRQIETKLEMWKNWRVFGLDILDGVYKKNIRIFGFDKLIFPNKNKVQATKDWQLLDIDQRYYLSAFQQSIKAKSESSSNWKYRQPSNTGPLRFNYIFTILIIAWGIIILLESLTQWCPYIQNAFFN